MARDGLRHACWPRPLALCRGVPQVMQGLQYASPPTQPPFVAGLVLGPSHRGPALVGPDPSPCHGLDGLGGAALARMLPAVIGSDSGSDRV